MGAAVLGSSRFHIISSHSVNFVGYMLLYVPLGAISTILQTQCHSTWKYGFVFQNKIKQKQHVHYSDFIMGVMASQITSVSFVYSTVCSDADQRKYQSSTSLAFVRGIHPLPMNSPHKGPVMRKIFPFDDVIMKWFKRAPCIIPLYVWQMYPRGWSHVRSFHFAVCGIESTSTQFSFWRQQNKARKTGNFWNRCQLLVKCAQGDWNLSS